LRSYFWRNEILHIARRNWLLTPYNVSHAKKKITFGDSLYSWETLYSLASFFNPFFSVAMSLCSTIAVMFREVFVPFFVWLRLKWRLCWFNFYALSNVYVRFFLTILKFFIFVFILCASLVLPTFCIIFLIKLQILSFSAVFYFYFFSIIFAFYLAFSFFVLQDYFIQLTMGAFPLNIFYEERYYYGMGFLTYSDTYIAQKGFVNEPQLFFSSFPVQYAADFHFILGGFYKSLNLIYIWKKNKNFVLVL